MVDGFERLGRTSRSRSSTTSTLCGSAKKSAMASATVGPMPSILSSSAVGLAVAVAGGGQHGVAEASMLP